MGPIPLLLPCNTATVPEPIVNSKGQHCGYKGEMYSYLEEEVEE